MSKLHYNVIAGQSLERLAALSDGIFGVAMTLLVLNLQVPVSAAGKTIRTEGDLIHALTAIAPSLLTYMMSFLTAGIFWVGQQTQFNQFIRVDRHLTWIHFGFLFAVSILPFSTALLASFIQFRTALLIYWFNIFVLGGVLLASWRYALSAKLLDPDVPPARAAAISAAMQNRIIYAQALYACGAALCVFNTYWSIGVMVLIQLNYAIAPRTISRSARAESPTTSTPAGPTAS